MKTATRGPLDLDAYFARIGYAGDATANAATLSALHRDHALRIPFENLDALLGRALRLDLAGLESKLVRERRGGGCLEHNTLFAAVLEQLGFKVTRLAARACVGANHAPSSPHLLLRVEADGASWIADVGFGGWGLLEPLPLEDGVECRQGAWTLRLRRDGETWLLECPDCPEGAVQYAFTLEPQPAASFEIANHSADSNHGLTVLLPSLNERRILRNRVLTFASPAGRRVESIASESALLTVLEKVFGLHLPAGTRFATGMDGAPAPD